MEFCFLKLLPCIFISTIFLIGFLGAFLPVIPASILVWAGIVIHKFWAGDFSISWNFLILATLLTIFAQILDFACTYWGARRFGASWKGILGAFVGLFAGFFIPFPGLILGPVLGAIIGELLGGQTLRSASKAGLGTIVGGFLAFVIKLAIVCFMIAGFYLNLLA